MKRVINRESMNPYDSSQVQSVLKGKAEIEPEWGKEVKRWKPKEGEHYYHFSIDNVGRIQFHITQWFNWDIDKRQYKIGNCFRTRKEAETKLKEIKKLLRGNNG